MSDTPETQEAVERWRQGKINIFDEMARLERERDEAIHGSCVNYNFTQDARRERDEARKFLLEIANASHFDNIGNWARNKAREALGGAK